MIERRRILKALAASAITLPFAGLFAKSARSAPSVAKRLIVFYFPDGVPAPQGQASRFHASGSELAFSLPENLAPLEPYRSSCVFLNGLSMGGTDAGSHPGGAKKLLTGVDGGGGESIDRYLARTVGAGSPNRHLYFGAMANQNAASGDKHISYPSPGTTVAPEDNPILSFQRLFVPQGNGTQDTEGASVIDTVKGDLDDVRSSLEGAERQKLDLHLEALREVERRVKGLSPTCGGAAVDISGIDASQLYSPERFPGVLRAHIDIMVQAMACGLSQVGVVQCSQHTSELIMSRFPATPLYKANFDMRSHQASHYGDPGDPKFADYVAQRTWFASQFAYLLGELQKRPDGTGTMLDSSVVLLCSEVCDGNTHLHDNMPFVLAGRAGGTLRTGRLLSFGYRRHSDLLLSLARAMGDGATSFGQECQGVLPGLFV